MPNSKLRSVLPSPLPDVGFGDARYIMGAWNGAAYDSHRDALIIPASGGHADYGGNEVYAFWLSSLKWERLTDPSPTTRNTVEELPDGRPASRHTYDGLAYLEHIGKVFMTGGSRWFSGGGSKGAWTFDVASRTWQRRADAPGTQLTAMTAYDPSTGRLFSLLENGVLAAYNPVTDSWTARGGTDGWAEFDPARTMVLHRARRTLLVVGGGEVFAFDLSARWPRKEVVVTTGGAPIVNVQGPGLAYDSASDRIIGWAGGGDVYTLDLKTRVWTRHASSSSAVPGPAPSQGTYGRWQNVPSKNIFIAVNSIDENVWLYRLAPPAPARPVNK